MFMDLNIINAEAFIILHCVFFPIVQTLASEVYVWYI